MIALDDNIEDHPKFVSLSDAAFALWVRCIGYCRRNLTDGYVPEQAARARIRSGKAEKVIAELCSPPAGLPNGNPLWLKVLGGYQVHDYLEWNPSKEQVEERREQKRAAAARGGQASGRTRAKQAAARDGSTKDEAQCFDSGSPLANSDPIRSDPDPREILPVPSLPLLPPENPRAAPAAAADENRAMAEIQAALARSKPLAFLATPEFSLRIAAHCREHGFTGKRSLSEVVTCIGEASEKLSDLEAAREVLPAGRIASLVIGCVKAGPKPVRSPGPGLQPISDRWEPKTLTVEAAKALPAAAPDDPRRF